MSEVKMLISTEQGKQLIKAAKYLLLAVTLQHGSTTKRHDVLPDITVGTVLPLALQDFPALVQAQFEVQALVQV